MSRALPFAHQDGPGPGERRRLAVALPRMCDGERKQITPERRWRLSAELLPPQVAKARIARAGPNPQDRNPIDVAPA
jgi:hypothetical protein